MQTKTFGRLKHRAGRLELANHGRRATPAWLVFVCLGSLVAGLNGSAQSTGDYPLVLTLDANAETATTAVTTRLNVRVDRLMAENSRKQVTDTLTHSGYSNFFNALRALPPIGEIGLEKRTVTIRYAREEQETTGRRLLLIADRPLFFLGDPAKPKAGYELTMVDLHFDRQGGVTGTMTGAARVKPSPDGVVLDDFSGVRVRLSTRATRP